MVRFWRARGVERAQLKWFTYAVSLTPLPFIAHDLAPALAGPLFAVILPLVPVSIGIAILRYRLYDIDPVEKATPEAIGVIGPLDQPAVHLDAGHAHQPCRQGGPTDTATPSSSRSSSWWPRPTRGGSCMWCWTTTAPTPIPQPRPAGQASTRAAALHPTSASWMNLVELFVSIITRQAIRRVSFASVGDLVAAIRRFVDGWNQRRQPFVWVKTPTTS